MFVASSLPGPRHQKRILKISLTVAAYDDRIREGGAEVESANQPPKGHEKQVWHCYVDGRLWPHCHLVYDEDGNFWPVFDKGCYPRGKVTLVLERAAAA
jgi:hypothetical protein